MSKLYGNSYQPFINIVQKNPDTKVIIYHTFLVSLLILTDPSLIK